MGAALPIEEESRTAPPSVPFLPRKERFMPDAETPFPIQVALLFALVALATLLLRAWLPVPQTSDAGPETELVASDADG